jgi:ketosteroid isomerase-like protein
VLTIVGLRFRGRASGIDVKDRGGIVLDLREGKATRMRFYTDVASALSDVGSDMQDTTDRGGE